MRCGDHLIGRLRLLLVVQCARRTYSRASRDSHGGHLHRAVRYERGRDGGSGRGSGLSLRSSSSSAWKLDDGTDSWIGGKSGARRSEHSARSEIAYSSPVCDRPKEIRKYRRDGVEFHPVSFCAFAGGSERESNPPRQPLGCRRTVLKTARATRPYPLPSLEKRRWASAACEFQGGAALRPVPIYARTCSTRSLILDLGSAPTI